MKFRGHTILYMFWWVYGAHIAGLIVIEVMYGSEEIAMWMIIALMWFTFYVLTAKMGEKNTAFYRGLIDDTLDAWRNSIENSNQPDWLVWSNEHKSWWAPGHKGYTSSREKAGRYTLEEAVNIVKGANIAIENNGVPNEAIIHD